MLTNYSNFTERVETSIDENENDTNGGDHGPPHPSQVHTSHSGRGCLWIKTDIRNSNSS
jgi:hypothetical protein